MSRRTKISGHLLRELRKEADLTQADLATRIGISRETVSAIENDKRETIEALGAEVISKWHMICAQSASAATRHKFFQHVMQYFGFSDMQVMNLSKAPAKSKE
ncbi:helix-turn-helix domain-containing protein [Paraglaciecola aestuariivivens]